MMKAKGCIDGHQFSGLTLMPLGNGTLFMPVNSRLRKIIGKQAGDTVRLTIYEDKAPSVVPDDLLICLADEKDLLDKFEGYAPGQKNAFVKWINSAKTVQTRVDRIARTINMVQNGEKFF